MMSPASLNDCQPFDVLMSLIITCNLEIIIAK
jgi:hypothetical protein